jgi:tRNA threonylcarbamoyl adenosine modification protein YeaZ
VHTVLILVVDSATPAITAALAELVPGRRPEILGELVSVDAKRHGELLAPQVGEVLRRAGARPRQLSAVVAGVGPGPFTGLRVGLVTAATLGDALVIPTYGVCSLDAINPGSAGRTLVATDARRREIYWSVYDASARITEPAVARPAVVAGELPGLGVIRAVGDGALRYADLLPVVVEPVPRYPVAAVLAERAADRVLAGAPGEPLTPLYLRRPDAMEPGTRKPVLR